MTSSLSSVSVDGTELSVLTDALTLNSSYTTVPSAVSNTDHFWSSDPRAIDSFVQEVIEVNFGAPSLINNITLDLAHFPQIVNIQFTATSDSNVWTNLKDVNTKGDIQITITDSFPAVLPMAEDINANQHPQHDFSGHWESFSFNCIPVEAYKIRFVMKRYAQGVAPINRYNKPLDYSLGLQNVFFGYQIGSDTQVPRSIGAEGSYTSEAPFATSSDIFGSTTSFSKRTTSAPNIMKNSDDEAPFIWKCEPQPFPWAVVNFYADTRDENNEGQLINRIFIDPLYEGAHITLYYSNDDADVDFDSSTKALPATTAFLQGNAEITDKMVLSPYGVNSYVQVNNDGYVDLIAGRPWWVGIDFQPSYPSTTDTNDHILFDAGEFQIGFNDTFYFLRTKYFDSVNIAAVFDQTDQQLMAYFDGESIGLVLQQDGLVTEATALVSFGMSKNPCTILTIGADVNGANLANCDINYFTIKQEVIPDLTSFIEDPQAYSLVSDYSEVTPGSINAILRFDPSQTSPSYPTGLIGGYTPQYESMVWTPVGRDYQTHRGFMKLPPIKAKYWNLEFTDLQAEYWDIFIPTTSQVKTFPSSITNAGIGVPTSDRYTVDDLATTVQSNLAYGSTRYNDIPAFVGTGGTGTGITASEVYISTDYSTSLRLSTQGNAWRYRQLHSDYSAARFSNISVHNYNIDSITPTDKIAYFVGLRQIIFCRVLGSTPQDFDVYEETFTDGSGIDSGNWVEDFSGFISSGSSNFARSTSTNITTQHAIKAVQFAAQQSDAQEILPDSEFDDLDHLNWNRVGDLQILGTVPSPIKEGNSLLVTREVNIGYYASISALYDIYDNISNVFTFGELEAGSADTSFNGGLASQNIGAPTGGRVYAAARVIADHDFDPNNPLFVQIVDGSNGNILAETPQPIKANELEEWTAEFEIEDLGVNGNTWGDLIGAKVLQTYSDGFARSDSSSLGTLDSGQLWVSDFGGTSLSIASGAATASITGARSYVDTGTPWGTLTVTIGNIQAPGTPVPLIDLGGLFLFSDGSFYDSTTANRLFYIGGERPFVAGHTYTFDFMLSSQAPISGGTQDTTLLPYSIILSDNGTVFDTIQSEIGTSTIKGLMGATGQTFTAFSWTPRHTQINDANLRLSTPQPAPTDIVILNDGSLYSWNETPTNLWYYGGYYTYGMNGLAKNFSSIGPDGFTTPGTFAVTDLFDQYGGMSFSVSQLPAFMDESLINIAYLQKDPVSGREITLRADGTVYDTSVASVIKTMTFTDLPGTNISIRYVYAPALSSAFKTTWSIDPSASQAIIIMQDEVIRGIISGNGVWDSTWRGIGGANNGTGSTNYTIIEGFGWYPDASLLAPDTSNITWDEVSYHDTRLYSQMENQVELTVTNIYAQLIQKSPSTDAWLVDSLALFWDAVVWEFSTDNGINWWKALDIKNNPNGVILFPQGLGSYSNLRWRITSYAPNIQVSNLKIRPWYTGYMRGIPVNPTQLLDGPNVSSIDQYAPIERDPSWQVWNNAIPRWWWANFAISQN